MEWIDLGDGVSVAEYTEPGHDGPAGLLWRHDCPDDPRGPESGGDAVPFTPPGPPEVWTLVSSEPLTLDGSLLCRACGRHGWIRDGAWVPA
jgi:hypothetical protein